MTNNGLNNGPASSGRPRTPPDLKAINAGWDGIPHATEVAAVLAAVERTNARQSTLKGLGEPPFEVPKIAGQVKVGAKPNFKRPAAWSVGTLTDVAEKARKNHAVKASIQSPLPPLMDEVYEGYKDGGEMSEGVVREILSARKELRDALANNKEKKTVNVIAAAYKDFEDRDRMSAAPTVTTAPVEVDTLKVLPGPDIDDSDAPEVDEADILSAVPMMPVNTEVDPILSTSTAPKLAAPDLTKDTAGRIPAEDVVRVNKLGFIIQHCKNVLAKYSARSDKEVSEVGYVEESVSIRPGLMSRLETALVPRAGLHRVAVQTAAQKKSLDLLKARRKMEMDLQGLDYLASLEVLETGGVEDLSELDKWGETPSEVEVIDFVNMVLSQSNLPLYAKVTEVHSRLIEDKRKAYEKACAEIEANDASYQADIDTLVNGQAEIRDEHGVVIQAATGASWWLKAKEAVFGREGNPKPFSSREAITIAPSNQSAAPNQSNVVTPSDEAATGAAASSVKAEKYKSRVIKALAGVLTVGAVLTGEELSTPNNTEEDAMEPVATKVVPMENPIYERVHADNAPAPAEMKATKATIVGVPIISVGPVAKQPAVRTTPIINVGKAKQAPATTQAEEKPAEEVAGPRLLTQADKDIALKKAMHNLASYKQRLAGLHKDDYKALTVEMKDLLLRRVDIINGILHTMRDDTDLEALNDVYKRMEEALTMLEKKRTAEIAPKYIASADVDVKLAIGRITNLKILLGAKTTKVTVKYKYHEVIDRHGRDSVAMYHPYTLDLAKMRADLEAIQRRVGPTGKYTPGSLHITEEQAKQDAVQAKYIADQLNWALWYARNGEKTMEYGEPVLMARNVKTSFSQTRK